MSQTSHYAPLLKISLQTSMERQRSCDAKWVLDLHLINRRKRLSVGGATDTTATTILSAVLAVATTLAGSTVLLPRTTAAFGGVRGGTRYS